MWKEVRQCVVAEIEAHLAKLKQELESINDLNDIHVDLSAF